MRPPYNLQTVTRGLFLQRNRASPTTMGSFRMPHVKAAAAAAISQGRAMCGRPPPLWMGVHAAMVSQTTRQASAGCGMHVL